MGTDRTAGRLSARCPTCQTVFRADTIKRLVKAMARCCLRKGDGIKLISAEEALDKPVLPALPWRCELERQICSQNDTTYSHWSVYSRDKNRWINHLRWQTKALQGLKLEWSQWRIERHYAAPMKEYDFANLVGGAKPIADCLIELGIIVDDRPANFVASYAQVRDTRKYTALILEAVSQHS